MRRNVDASDQTIPLYDPFDANGNIIPNAANRPRMQCNGVLDVICPQRIDPTAQRLFVAAAASDDPTTERKQLPLPQLLHSRSRLPSIKADYIFNDKHRMSYLFSHFFSPAILASTIRRYSRYRLSHPESASVSPVELRLRDPSKPTKPPHIGFNHRHLIEAPDYVSSFPRISREPLTFLERSRRSLPEPRASTPPPAFNGVAACSRDSTTSIVTLSPARPRLTSSFRSTPRALTCFSSAGVSSPT